MTDTPKTDALREMLKQPCSCGNDGNLNKDFHDEFCPWANGEALAVREYEKLERELNEAKALYDATAKTAHATLNAQLRADVERYQWRECAQRLAEAGRDVSFQWNRQTLDAIDIALARFDELEKGVK